MTFADDAGEYVILAKNQLGEVSASTNLLEEGVSTNTASKNTMRKFIKEGRLKRIKQRENISLKHLTS